MCAELLQQLLAVPREWFNAVVIDLIRCCGRNYVYCPIERKTRNDWVCAILNSDPADHTGLLRQLILASPNKFCESLLQSVYSNKVRGRSEAFGTNALTILRWFRPVLQSYIAQHTHHGFERLANMGTELRPVTVVLRGLFEHGLVERELYLASILEEVWKYYSGPLPDLRKLTQMLRLLHDLYELPVDADTVVQMNRELAVALVTIIDGLRDKLLEPGVHCVVNGALYIAVEILRKTLAIVKHFGRTPRVIAAGVSAHPLTRFYFRLAFELPADLREPPLRDLAAANTYWPPVDPAAQHHSMEQFLAEMVQRATWPEMLQLAHLIDPFHFCEALSYLLRGNREGPFISGPGLLRCVNLLMGCMLGHYLPAASQSQRQFADVLPMIKEMMHDIIWGLDEAPSVLRQIEYYTRTVSTTNMAYRRALNAVRLAARRATVQYRRYRR